jgi:glucuronoarabinoxylan endo-1,4-beta-xylanase
MGSMHLSVELPDNISTLNWGRMGLERSDVILFSFPGQDFLCHSYDIELVVPNLHMKLLQPAAWHSGRKSVCLSRWLGALLASFLQAGACSAQNLAQNPGFESGNTSGWSAFGPTTISAQSTTVHSGSYAGLVQNRTAAWNGIAQSLLGVVQPGQLCNLSVWVRLASGTSQTVQMTMKKVDGNGDGYTAIASGTVSTGGWTQLAGQYTLEVSGTLTALTLYCEVPTSTNAAFYVDDLIVEAAGSGYPDGVGQSTINWQEVHQRIDGFGASSAWRSQWTATQADMLFSTNSGTGRAKDGTTFPFTGVGLSLLRTRIAPGATTVEQTIMQLAQARGAQVWSAPWSPATQFKSNGSVNGGSFIGNAANYQAYASQLAGYVANMKSQHGVTLYALSVQNEPDADVTTYESCNWTAQQIHDFIPYLASALVASNVGATRVMLPESQNWTDPQGLRLTTMNDPSVAPLVGIIANHNYVPDNANGDQTTPAAVTNYGKALWETEVAKLSGSDSTISDGLYWAKRVHLFLTAAEANAWHYWWLYAYQVSNGGLCDTNEVPAKRMYTLGNFSRFVRPGFYRIGISNNISPLQISAYKHPTNRNFAIVAINPTTTNVSQVFNLNGFTIASSITPWLTSASTSLAAQAPVAVGGGVFTNTIPGQSVVTLVGVADPGNSAPTNIALSGATLGEHQPTGTIIGAFSTTDPDSSNTFTYTLVSGTGSADNGSFNISGSNLLSGTSFNYETQNAYSIRVRSTDQGGLYVEKAFTITVTNLNEAPSLAAISDRSTGAGVVISITNVATDPDLPTQTFTFSLLSGPAGSTLNPTNGVFSWRPLVSQAGSTNAITVGVVDDGVPVLSATNSFTITVDPLGQAALGSIAVAGGQVSIAAGGPLGPDYTLLTSTNLANWQTLLTTNPAATPFTLTDTNHGDAARFYRLQLGP